MKDKLPEQIAASTSTISNSISNFYEKIIDMLPGVITAILIVIIGVLIATLIGNFSRKRIAKRTSDPLMSKFLGKAIKISIILMTIMVALRAAGLGGIAAGVLAAAGASAVVLGFAFKDIGENFIAGIILSFSRPFNVNDTVQIGEVFGKVKALEFRYTKLKTFDGKDVYIPNSDVLTKPVTNYTEDGFFRWDFVVGIAFEDDINEAKRVILNSLKNEPNVMEDEEHENFVVEDELATSTVNLKIYFWVDTKDFRRQAMITRGNVIRSVKEDLANHGFYLPADIQEIKLYGKEADFPLRFDPPKAIESKAKDTDS